MCGVTFSVCGSKTHLILQRERELLLKRVPEHLCLRQLIHGIQEGNRAPGNTHLEKWLLHSWSGRRNLS